MGGFLCPEPREQMGEKGICQNDQKVIWTKHEKNVRLWRPYEVIGISDRCCRRPARQSASDRGSILPAISGGTSAVLFWAGSCVIITVNY